MYPLLNSLASILEGWAVAEEVLFIAEVASVVGCRVSGARGEILTFASSRWNILAAAVLGLDFGCGMSLFFSLESNLLCFEML